MEERMKNRLKREATKCRILSNHNYYEGQVEVYLECARAVKIWI